MTLHQPSRLRGTGGYSMFSIFDASSGLSLLKLRVSHVKFFSYNLTMSETQHAARA